MTDLRPIYLRVISHLSRRDWSLLLYRPRTGPTIQQVNTRAPSFVGVLASHAFQLYQVQELSKKAKWIQ